MNEKKSFSKRNSYAERRSNRNTHGDGKEFTSSCNPVGRNEELEQRKSTRESTNVSLAHNVLATGQYRLSDISDSATSSVVRNTTFNIFSKNFSGRKSKSETNFESDISTNRNKSLYNKKSDVLSLPLGSVRRDRNLPSRTTLSQESIANITKKLGKLKEEMLHSGHGSESAIASKSSDMTSKRTLNVLRKTRQTPIILPKEQFRVLQERIKNEIKNLKCLENTVKCENITKSAEEVKKESEDDTFDDLDLEELGSDIQFLPVEVRDKLMRKYSNPQPDNKIESNMSESKNSKVPQNNVKLQEEVLTIDLTKDTTPCKEIEKTVFETDNDYPSLDLDYGSKIDWDDGDKSKVTKHSTVATEKAIVNLDIDESKLTSETSKKLTDIKNKLSRSLSIGLSHKETDKDNSSESKSNMINIPVSEEQGDECENSAEDAETLELASLRCTSECTEAIADRERRRKRRCADYPGLAFGFSIFSSDTMMKFNIIRNELHNIMNTQLKRVCIN